MSLLGLLKKCDLCGSDYQTAPEDSTGRLSFNFKETDEAPSSNFLIYVTLNGAESDLCPECRKVLIYMVNSRWGKRNRATGGG